MTHSEKLSNKLSNRHLARAEYFKSLNIKYIHSDQFETLSSILIANDSPEMVYEESTRSVPPAGNGMMESPLLTTDGETWLFRKMNFLKYAAYRDCLKLTPQTATAEQIQRIEDLLEQIQTTRSMIVEANTRLVSSIAHKFSNSIAEYEDLVSEGNMILVNAVDKFDFSRGFRFSTYATHAVQRHYFRFLQRQQKRKNREAVTSTEILSDVVPYIAEDEPLDYTIAHALIEHFEDCLDDREATIIKERFGLNDSESSATLKVVAERVGLSKERVRQLQMRAIEKLQDLAIQMNLRLEPSF